MEKAVNGIWGLQSLREQSWEARKWNPSSTPSSSCCGGRVFTGPTRWRVGVRSGTWCCVPSFMGSWQLRSCCPMFSLVLTVARVITASDSPSCLWCPCRSLSPSPSQDPLGATGVIFSDTLGMWGILCSYHHWHSPPLQAESPGDSPPPKLHLEREQGPVVFSDPPTSFNQHGVSSRPSPPSSCPNLILPLPRLATVILFGDDKNCLKWTQ